MCNAAAVMGRNKYLIILGSNTDSCTNLAVAEDGLHRCFGDYVSGEAMLTAPIGMPGSPAFTNKCIAVVCDRPVDEVKAICKSVEAATGRRPDDKRHGIVRIDIDLVAAGDTVLKPDDYRRDYAQGFIPVYEALHADASDI